MGTTNLSTEYPKWLYAKGQRDLLVYSVEEETKARAKGYSHEYVDNEPKPVASQVAVTNEPQPGTVPTSVMDAAIENLKARFDSSWAEKCNELAKVSDTHRELQAQHQQVLVDHEATKLQLASLGSDHAKLITEHAAALAQIADLTTPKPAEVQPAATPVQPPVAAKPVTPPTPAKKG